MKDSIPDQADVARAEGTGDVQKARIFISYKRNLTPDEPVALRVYEALSRQHTVFIDQDMPVGTRWAECIEAELRRSDFLIIFLSAASVHSEMVLAEIETAHRLAEEQGGCPILLPVRMAYKEPFAYPLSTYLNLINWASWEGSADTPRLIEELQSAIAGGVLPINGQAEPGLLRTSPPGTFPQPLAAAQPLRLERPGGTIDLESRFYVERPEDEIALEAVAQKGMTLVIKAPRQMGKSSLLIRMMHTAEDTGKRVAFLDFQLFEKATLHDPDRFYRQFCSAITDALDLDDLTDEYWRMPLGNSRRCMKYLGRYVLDNLDAPLLLAMDEVDKLFGACFRNDFFGMLRSWHNRRATSKIWKGLDLALVISTEPYLLVEDLTQSPFNVGEVIELEDFTPEQVADLNRRHGAPLSRAGLGDLAAILQGHPYLTRRALYLVASGRSTLDTLRQKASDDRGPFGDHLRYHLFQLHGHDDLIEGLRLVIRHQRCPDEEIFWRLRGAGLVRRNGARVKPRCKLYADYFWGRLYA